MTSMGPDEAISAGLAQLTALLGDAEAKLSAQLTQLAAEAAKQQTYIRRLATLPAEPRQSLPDKLDDMLESITGRVSHDIADASAAATRVAGEAESFRTSMRDVDAKSADIEDIAHRTRLVALNASATAERAGTQGRAFGVIAQQVTELPLQAARLSVEVGELTRAAEQHLIRAITSLRRAAESSQEAVAANLEQLAAFRRELGSKNEVLRTSIDGAERASRAIDDLSKTSFATLTRFRRATRALDHATAPFRSKP